MDTFRRICIVLTSLAALVLSVLCVYTVVLSKGPSAGAGMILIFLPGLIGVQIVCAAVALLLLTRLKTDRLLLVRIGCAALSLSIAAVIGSFVWLAR